MRKSTILTLVTALLVAGLISFTVAQDSYYAGETIEIIVPFSPGGGTDTWARLVAPFLQQELGGGAVIQVVNVPGAGSVAGANEFAVRRSPDGLTTMAHGGSTVMAYVLGEEAVLYDFADFQAVIGSALGGVVYVRPGLGIDSAADLLDVSEQLIYGGISATGLDLLPLLAFEVLDLDVLAIMGYEGRGPARIAFEQGETTIDYQTSAAYLSNVVPPVEQGDAVPLFTFGAVDADGDVIRDTVFADLPSVREVHLELYGEEPSGPAWEIYSSLLGAMQAEKMLWVHGNAPAEAIAELVAAAERVVANEEFRDAARAVVGDYPFITGDVAQRTFGAVTGISQDSIDWVMEFLREEHGVER
jgi:tripartite-type tricarboxylate transporter receptor subunit TctC